MKETKNGTHYPSDEEMNRITGRYWVDPHQYYMVRMMMWTTVENIEKDKYMDGKLSRT